MDLKTNQLEPGIVLESEIASLCNVYEEGYMQRHSSLFLDEITKLYEKGVLATLVSPEEVPRNKIFSIISAYLGGYRNNKSAIDPTRFHNTDSRFDLAEYIFFFGMPHNLESVPTKVIPFVELGGWHMPESYLRLNLNFEDSIPEVQKCQSQISALYSDAVNNRKPIFAKFTSSDADSYSFRLCSYVNKSLLEWQLKTMRGILGKELCPKIYINNSGRHVIQPFGDSTIEIRMTGEADFNKTSQEETIAKTVALIQSIM